MNDLVKLRRIAEAANQEDDWIDPEALMMNAYDDDTINHIATFDPPTMLTLLDELENLRGGFAKAIIRINDLEEENLGEHIAGCAKCRFGYKCRYYDKETVKRWKDKYWKISCVKCQEVFQSDGTTNICNKCMENMPWRYP